MVVYFLVGLVLLLGLALLWPAGRASRLPGVEKLDLSATVRLLVAAAEQTMPGQTGAEKLGFVLREIERMTSNGQLERVHMHWLRIMIEAAVYALKQKKDQA